MIMVSSYKKVNKLPTAVMVHDTRSFSDFKIVKMILLIFIKSDLLFPEPSWVEILYLDWKILDQFLFFKKTIGN